MGLLEAAATRGVTLTGPVKDGGSGQQRRGDGFAREDFHIDFDKRQVTCPRGKTTGNWLELPSQAPYTLVRFSTSATATRARTESAAPARARAAPSTSCPATCTNASKPTAPSNKTRSGCAPTPPAPASRAR